ncbi:MAG: 50S ribosomal protein L25 [Anaerovoracaceae bacterium]
MDKITGTVREPKSKAKQLRSKGLIPGVLYGKSMDESISLMFPQLELERFLRKNSVGYKVEVEVEGVAHLALVKELTFTPVVNKIEHVSFQALVKGEKVNSSAQIVLLNQEMVRDTVLQSLYELHYKAGVEDIFTRVEIDLEGKEAGFQALVSDLNIPNRDKVEVLVPEDSLVVSIVEKAKIEVEEEAEEEAVEGVEEAEAALEEAKEEE